jgi:pSer/pThr/pTyr-binding forkhead associated (FHA) protein
VKLDRPVCVIGRHEVGVHLPLQSPQVSKMHALVVRDARGVYLRDLASTNGVQRNGAPVQEAGLSDEDILRIGSYTLRCDSGFSRNGTSGALPAAELVGDGVTFPFPVGQQTVLIGRRVGCDLRIDEEDVAPVHAIVFELDGQRHVRDLNTPGGTYVNGHKIHQEALNAGDELRIGSASLRYTPIHAVHDVSDIPPLDAPMVPELDEPQIAHDDADHEPPLAEMDESRIALIDESSASIAVEAPPQPAPSPVEAEAPADPLDESRIPLLDESVASVVAEEVLAQAEPAPVKSDTPPERSGESRIAMHDSIVSLEDSQAPGTPDVGSYDSNILEPPPPHEPSFHGEVVEFAGDVFPIKEPARLPLSASALHGNGLIDDKPMPMASHVDDEQPAVSKPAKKRRSRLKKSRKK